MFAMIRLASVDTPPQPDALKKLFFSPFFTCFGFSFLLPGTVSPPSSEEKHRVTLEDGIALTFPSVLLFPVSYLPDACALSVWTLPSEPPRCPGSASINKARGAKRLLNGCILLAGSEQAVYGGACQLLPLGCCSMWKH